MQQPHCAEQPHCVYTSPGRAAPAASAARIAASLSALQEQTITASPPAA